MPDSSAIDNALVAKLGADQALLAIATNGDLRKVSTATDR